MRDLGGVTMIPTFAVIVTKNRPDLVRACRASIAGQVRGTVIVDNNDEPDESLADRETLILHRPGYPPNLSELLNLGLNAAQVLAFLDPVWNVVMLNDDVEVPPGWVELLNEAMRSCPAALAYVDRISRPTSQLFTGLPVSPIDSMTGWACMMRGELGLRWNEDLKWWYSDSLLDYECRLLHGGVLAVPGVLPVHHHPSEQTFADPVLAAQTRVDEARFREILRERGW